MAIGTTAALLGSAALGAGASIYGASKASKTASKAAQANNELLQKQYDTTRNDLMPYTQAGYAGMGALLGLPGLVGPQADYGGYLDENPDVAAWAAQDGDPTNDLEQARFHYGEYGRGEGRQLGMAPSIYDDRLGQRPTSERPIYPSAPSAASFFTGFEHSPGYENMRNEALRAVNVGNSARGTYFSGGRGIALEQKAADIASQDYNNWWNRQNSLYQTALQQYNQDRAFANSNYDVDAARSDARYDADRGFASNRADTRTNDLFRLIGIGSGSAGALANAGQANAQAQAANNTGAASVQANAALAGAGQVNSLLGTALGAYGMYKGGGTIWGGAPNAPKIPAAASYGYTGGSMAGLY